MARVGPQRHKKERKNNNNNQLIKSSGLFRKFPPLFSNQAVAHQLLTTSILALFPTSPLHLARSLPTPLSPSGCTYLSPLGIKISSILVT
jgi:hypothetical protein